MTEWGRNSAAASRPPARLPWVALGILLGMAMAGGGLYAAWPGTDIAQERESGSSTAATESLRARIAKLEEELAAERSRADTGRSGDARYQALEKRFQDQAGRLKDLTGRLEIAEKLNGELQAALDKAPQSPKAESDAVASLRVQIAEREDLLRKFDAELAQAEGKLAALAAERDALKAKAGDGGAAKAAELEAKLAAALADADALRRTVGERDKALGEMDAEIARLEKFEAEAGQLRAALGAKPSASAEAAAEKAARLAAEERLLAAERDATALKARIDRADKEAADAIAARQAAETAAGKAAGDARKLLDGANAQVASLNARIAALDTEIASLKKQAAAKASEKPSGLDIGGPARAREPRDPLRVAQAMARAKGLENLDETQRDRIGEGLIEGECVAKVLTDVFGRPPAVAVRDLVNALESDC